VPKWLQSFTPYSTSCHITVKEASPPANPASMSAPVPACVDNVRANGNKKTVLLHTAFFQIGKMPTAHELKHRLDCDLKPAAVPSQLSHNGFSW
jgi:hypothetical protein